MMTLRIGSLKRRCVGGAMAIIVPMFMLACAELEVGAEAAKRVNSAVSGSKVAQATEPAAIEVAETTSPLLEAAPQLFEATGVAVWDGKRTLQGIWVAHPLAASARRVRIFNEQSGLAVDGALFRREASLEGSSVLISSEAARLLGMEIDQPADLRIVAVKPAPRPVPEPQPAPGTAETGDGAVADGQAGQTSDTVETSEIASATPASETPAVESPAAETTPEPTVPAPTATAETPQQSVTTETPTQTAAAVPSTPTKTGVIAEAPTEPALPAAEELATPEPAAEPAAPAIAEAPQVQPVPKPETAVEAPKPADPPAVAAPAEEKIEIARADDAASAPSSTLAKPFIQAGIFGVANNATKLVARFKSAGIPAQGKSFKSNGKTLTRVVAGPFQSVSDRDKAQREIRQMGLTDAVPVRR